MKHIITILSLIILTSCGTKMVNEYGLNRNVKSFTIKTYDMVSKFGEYCKGEIDLSKDFEDCLYEFTKDGLLKSKSTLEIRGCEFTGNIDGKDIYNYDTDGRIISEYSYYSSGDLMSYTNYEYDSNGNCISKKHFDDDNSLIWTITNIYDTDNRIIKHIHNDEPHNIGVFEKKAYEDDYELTYVYDDNGKEIKHIIHNFKTISQKENTYEVEIPNNIIETNEYGLVSRINNQTFEYTYDKYGNWITLIISEDSVPKSLIEREITY